MRGQCWKISTKRKVDFASSKKMTSFSFIFRLFYSLLVKNGVILGQNSRQLLLQEEIFVFSSFTVLEVQKI